MTDRQVYVSAWANANRIPVEHAKPAEERGTFLFPEGFGHPSAADAHARRRGLPR